MKYLRRLYRIVTGTTADSFTKAQAKELDEVLADQAEAKGKFIKDVQASMEFKSTVIEATTELLAKDQATLNKLQEK